MNTVRAQQILDLFLQTGRYFKRFKQALLLGKYVNSFSAKSRMLEGFKRGLSLLFWGPLLNIFVNDLDARREKFLIKSALGELSNTWEHASTIQNNLVDWRTRYQTNVSCCT